MPAINKNHLLELLAGNKNRYKRYQGLPLRYPGGKSLAVGYIVEHFPDSISELVSPFFGGGSVEIACAKNLNVKVLGFDVFDELMSYWRCQINSPSALAAKISEWQPCQETYKSVKERLKQHWDKSLPIDNEMDLAAHFWFNFNLSYGPGFLGWMSKIYEDENRYDRLLKKVEDFDGSNITAGTASFENIIPSYPESFIYADPPYYLDGDSRMFKGIYPQRNFPVYHRGFAHEKLRDMLVSHKGGFVISYNDCSAVREWYKDYKIVEVQWQYTLGQGETRIGKNRKEDNADHVKKSHEIIIIGY